MEFPFNHGHHHNSNVTHTHHHSRRYDDDEESPNYPPPGVTAFPPQPPPPSTYPPYPPVYGVDQPPPPHPHPHHPETHVFHTGHVSHDFNNPTPPPSFPPPPQPHHHQADHSFDYNYPSAPPPNPNVHHVSHETHHISHNNQFPSSAATVHHIGHQSGPDPVLADLSNKRTVRVITKAAPDFALTIRDGKVILARSDPGDEYQHWYKDEKYSTRVKDEEGCPAFSLVNKVTGEAIKHSIGATHPVRLVPYNPDYLDESVLWTESWDLGDGHRTVRMVNNIRLNVDAFHGDKNSGGVHDGTTIVLWEWNKGDNQRWKILSC